MLLHNLVDKMKGNKSMTFDSFLVIDDDGTQHKIKFLNSSRVNVSRHIRKLKHSYKETKQLQLQSKRSYDMFRHVLNNYHREFVQIPIYNTGKHHCASWDGSRRGLKEFYIKKGTPENKVDKAIELHSKATKYRNRHVSYVSKEDISPSTSRNMKRALGKYGNFSLRKRRYGTGYYPGYLLVAHDDNVYKHLYFYNSETKEKISIYDYITINSMMYNSQYDTKLCCQVVRTKDTLDRNEIMILHDDVTAIWFLDLRHML